MKLIISAFHTPAGWLEVTHDEQHIHRAFFCDTPSQTNVNTDFCRAIVDELDAYFSDPFHRFQLPLKPQGSFYQQQVWKELLVIPAGRALTYGELACRLQSSPRAVGEACKKNPVALFVPCHRVIGKNNYGGFMGKKEALHFKLALLAHEGFSFVL